MKKLFVLLSLGLLSVCCRAQSFTATTTGTITISTSLSLTFTSLVGTVSITTTSDYLGGKTTNNAGKLEIDSNVPWMVKISANSSLFTATGGGASSNMPASVVGVRVDGGSSFLTLSTTQQTLKTGNSGSASTSGNTFYTDINYNPGLSYNGGNYSLGLVYTLTAQ